MRLIGFAVTLAVSLIVATAASGGPVLRQYTLPAAPPEKLSPTGTLTVWLPAAWKVKTGWGTPDAPNATPWARDRVHKSVVWYADVLATPKATTLADMRKHMLGWSGEHMWGEKTPMRRMVGDMYMTLPIGHVWRYTLAYVPLPDQTKYELSYQRFYVLDRGVVRYGERGEPRRLFNLFSTMCSATQCPEHNSQLAAVMRSMRLSPK